MDTKIPKKISPVKYKSFYTIRAVKAKKDTFELESVVNSYYLKKNIDWNTSIHKQYHWHFDSLSGDIDSFRKDEMIKMDLSYFKQLLQVHYIHDLLRRYLRNSIVLEMNTTSDSTILHFRGKLIKDKETDVAINGGFLVFGKEDQMLKRAKLNLSYTSFNREMEYKIIETEKGQREKVFKGNTMLYKKTKVEHDSEIIEYEMVVTYYEANIEFGVFRENEIVKDEELRKFLEDVFLDYMLNNSIPSLD